MHNRDILHQKSGKANFELVYDREDPREYFNILGEFDYCVPHHGQLVFDALAQARRNADQPQKLGVMDVCCSYGINAALLKYETSLDDLYDRYRSTELSEFSSEELAEADAAFYGERLKRTAPKVVGVDVARNAVAYGVRSGLLDEGFAENLEENEPTQELRRALAEANLLTITGGVGYVSERTFERLRSQ